MTVSLATPCRNCSHPLNVHDNGGDQRVVRVCITCSCERYEPDACYWGHTEYCEHQDSPVMREINRPPLGFDSQAPASREEESLREFLGFTETANPERTKYETKDSGVRAEFDSGMVRDTQDGKARFELLLTLGVPYSDQLLTRVGELLARCAAKYDSRNWEKAAGEEEL